MLSFTELDRMCGRTISGAFGLTLLRADSYDIFDFRQVFAGVANLTCAAVVQTPVRAGLEQGNE
ncbi:hypothetical protein STA1M1_28550 [Sinisalibacter aestuarii]|uniref:Uncharacterized protein n=2 Tax=Sinisalibacter aestuarii TaxID=2949426 RepID=A0ABQ5LX84_9RHOB|nr:hypothetical protein STA1M1_28550 [Sinisalibacter aestuarii]